MKQSTIIFFVNPSTLLGLSVITKVFYSRYYQKTLFQVQNIIYLMFEHTKKKYLAKTDLVKTKIVVINSFLTSTQDKKLLLDCYPHFTV